MDRKETIFNLIMALKAENELAESTAYEWHRTNYNKEDIIREKIDAAIDDKKILCSTEYDDGTGFHIHNEMYSLLQSVIGIFNDRYDDYIDAAAYVPLDAVQYLAELTLDRTLVYPEHKCIEVAFNLTNFICNMAMKYPACRQKTAFNKFIVAQTTESFEINIFSIYMSIAMQLIKGNKDKVIHDFEELYEPVIKSVIESVIKSVHKNWDCQLNNLNMI